MAIDQKTQSFDADRFLREQVVPFIDGELTTGELIGLSLDDLTSLVQLGISSLSAGRLDDSRKVFTLIAGLEPDLYLPHHYLGMIEERANNLELAADAYLRAGALLEAQAAPAKDTEETKRDIAFVLAGVLLRLNRTSEAAVYLLELDAERASLDPAVAAQVRALLGRLGLVEE